MANVIDINCDMGESFGAYQMGQDEAVMPYITSANIACGFHAGDPRTMLNTIRLAKIHQVQIGAHPSFPDLVGFGRRPMHLSYLEAYSDVLYQIGSLHALATSQGMALHHVKPHGQLNNMAVTDGDLAQAIVDAVWDFDSHLILITYGGFLSERARAKGLAVAHEVYADREYQDNGQLVPRSKPHAVIHDVSRIVSRAIDMVLHQTIPTVSGKQLPAVAHTICVHGDTPEALGIVTSLRQGLASAGIPLRGLQNHPTP